MASYRNENRPDSGDLLSWIITIVLLVSPVWPIGLILLLRKLTGGSRRRASRHPYDIQREGGPVPGTQGMPGAQRQTPPVGRQHVGRSPRQGRPVNLDRGKGLTVWGIVLTVIFGIALTGFPAVAMSGGFLSALAVMSPVIGFFGGGLAMIWAGTQRTKKAKRFRKYLALIGRRESISITTLAQAMPVSVHKACDDLQDMLDSGILETGYLDMSTGRLILSDEGLQEEAPPAPEPDEPEPEEDVLDMNDDDAVLGEIRRLNDDTRSHFHRLFDWREWCICPEALADGWQTGTSKRITRLAFNLWNGYGQEQPEDERVSAAFLPDEIFCCGFQSCFFEAVRLRFPEYADAASSLPCMGPG